MRVTKHLLTFDNYPFGGAQRAMGAGKLRFDHGAVWTDSEVAMRRRLHPAACRVKLQSEDGIRRESARSLEPGWPDDRRRHVSRGRNRCAGYDPEENQRKSARV